MYSYVCLRFNSRRTSNSVLIADVDLPGQQSRFVPLGKLSSSCEVGERPLKVAGRDYNPEEKHFTCMGWGDG